jgi:putative PIN family toxin of toxin-antitoxin system
VLGDKFEADSRAVEQVVAQLALISTTVKPQERVSVISDDPSDNRVLEAALAGNATIVVSGDRHLLKLREWRGIRILDPAAFLQEYE